MEYLYAFDLSMECTGLVIFDKQCNPILITSIPTDDKQTHSKRLKVIADKLLELKSKYPPYKVVIERGFSRFNTSTQVVYRVHGLINYLFVECEQIYYPPKKVKEAILNGNATKKQLQDKIKKLYPGIQFSTKQVKDKKTKQIRIEENEDESDAFAVGLTYFIEQGVIKIK